MKFVIVNGAARSGKDTFANVCCKILRERGQYGEVLSTVDKVKELAYAAGWDGSKELDDRLALSDLKDLLTRWLDMPWKDIHTRADKIKSVYEDSMNKPTTLFIMVREPEEIQRYAREDGATTIFIQRDIAQAAPTSNHADANVMQYQYDYYIDNNGSIEDLIDNASIFLDALEG